MISVQCARKMQSPEICKAKAVNELPVTHDVLLQNQWNNMAVDLLFRGVLPRSTRIFNLNENLLNRLSQAEVIHATDFRVIPFSYTLAKFTTLKCSSLINTALFNTILKALDYEQPLFFLSPSSKTHETRKWPRARASRSFAPPARLHCSH